MPARPPARTPARRGPAKISKSAAATKHPYHAARSAAVSAVRAQGAAKRALRPSKRVFREITVAGVFNDGRAILGVAGGPPVTTKKPLTAKQKAAVEKYNAAVIKTKKADEAAKKAGAAATAVADRKSTRLNSSHRL